ncbi:hypothetical protein ABKV19_006195 [Rosa sericea]
MAKTPPTAVQDSTKAYKLEEHYPQEPYKSSARSLITFFFSILIYTSIFYIFNLSPSTLFYNTKFWFAISNTLILIIAADYSSSKDKHDQINYQEEYMMHRQAQTTSSFVLEYPREIVKETIIDHQVARQNIRNPENRQIVLKDEHDEKPSVDDIDVQEKKIVHVQSKGGKKENIQAKTYKRSKSEEEKRVVIDECKSNIIRRSETKEKHEETQVSTPEEVIDEFSTMSDEELIQLNRRCEEFIQRFNEQIRHQSVADRRPKKPTIMSKVLE